MGQVGAAAVCGIVAGIVILGFVKGLPVFELFIEGAKSGVQSTVKLLPTLIGLITAIAMLRASGMLELLTGALQPILQAVGVHPELVPLMLLRPLSGSGAVSYVTDLFTAYGAESEIARTAAILSSATETTFYAAAVYFGGRGYRSTKYVIPAALCGDLTAAALAVLSVHLFG